VKIEKYLQKRTNKNYENKKIRKKVKDMAMETKTKWGRI